MNEDIQQKKKDRQIESGHRVMIKDSYRRFGVPHEADLHCVAAVLEEIAQVLFGGQERDVGHYDGGDTELRRHRQQTVGWSLSPTS